MGILLQITGPYHAESYCIGLRSKTTKIIFVTIIKQIQKRYFQESMVNFLVPSSNLQYSKYALNK